MTGKLVIGAPVTNAIYANDAAVKMTVQGTIVSKRIVCATPAWADFVFDKNYKLELNQSVGIHVV